MLQRIQKLVAGGSRYSRREVERLIEEGKVKVNGKTVRVQGLKIDPARDRIVIAGRPVSPGPVAPTFAILMNKPRQTIVTRSDPEGRPTVYDLLPRELKAFKPAGRLDFNSQGALILTNDGALIQALTHPSFQCRKVYEVKLSSHPDERQLQRLARGVVIDGARTLPAAVDVISRGEASTRLRMTLSEGRNRQIRKMCEAVGLTVKELHRVAIGGIRLKNLRSGRFRVLAPAEIAALKRSVRDG